MVQEINPAKWQRPARIAEEEDETMSLDQEQMMTIQAYIDQQIAPIAFGVERLYGLLRILTPEKKFLAAVDIFNQKMQEAQKAPEDPRIARLESELASLKKDMGKVIAEAVKGVAEDLKGIMRPTVMHANNPDEEMDFGEPS